uniref:Similar to MIM (HYPERSENSITIVE TO MMS, IRRADIATION AND MMC) n=1 Tax=Arundo donax TaxID=35708 RepID=A0A0A9FN31_ARUDO
MCYLFYMFHIVYLILNLVELFQHWPNRIFQLFDSTVCKVQVVSYFNKQFIYLLKKRSLEKELKLILVIS